MIWYSNIEYWYIIHTPSADTVIASVKFYTIGPISLILLDPICVVALIVSYVVLSTTHQRLDSIWGITAHFWFSVETACILLPPMPCGLTITLDSFAEIMARTSKSYLISYNISSSTTGCDCTRNISQPIFMVGYDVWSKSYGSGSLYSNLLVLGAPIPYRDIRSTLGRVCTYSSIGVWSDKHIW